MIERVTFKNFKALRDVSIDLSPFTLIVGPNASGKTSILEGLRCLTQVMAWEEKEVFSGNAGPEVVRSCGADGPVELGMDVRCDELLASVLFTATRSDGKPWTLATIVKLNGEGYPVTPALRENFKGLESVQKQLRAMRSAVLLRLDPGPLAARSGSVTPSRGEFDGSNLSVTLAKLALDDPGALTQLAARVREVVPVVDSVALASSDSQGGPLHPYQTKIGFKGGAKVLGPVVSEGTLITLGLLTVMSTASQHQLVMVDEMERGLHPKALGKLVTEIRAIMERTPGLQVIGTTHSPYLLDHFFADEIRLTTLADDGSVIAGKLNDHPDFERWKDEMKPGEFWSSVGEDWLRDRKGPNAG